MTVGAPTPFQHAAVTALAFDDAYYAGLADHYTQARDFLHGVLTKNGFKAAKPKGAYYIITDVADLMPRLGAKDDFDFSRRLIETTGVATVPGSSFYSDKKAGLGRTQVRFTYCKKWETLHAVEGALQKPPR